MEGWEDPSAKVVGGVDDPVKNCCGWEEMKVAAYRIIYNYDCVSIVLV